MAATQDPPVGELVALRFDGRALIALDQTALPWHERELHLRTAAEVADAIARLSIRGAPLIGVAAGYGVALELAALELAGDSSAAALDRGCALLRDARPTAVNLAHAVERVRSAALGAGHKSAAGAALEEARAVHQEEEAASAAMAAHGADMLVTSGRILTHCNTGALAAPGRGTALGVVAELARRGLLEGVLITESRPLLQGARLTAYELLRLQIPYQLIVDAAAPGLIAAGDVGAVVVGCDRVAANGDVANKVGTYGLALAAQAGAIPFIVVGPTSSIDPSCATGSEIEIEERDPEEVRRIPGAPDASSDGAWLLTTCATDARNPAFDVTPAALVTALVTERGVASPVRDDSISALLEA